jgi:hypothetical protein
VSARGEVASIDLASRVVGNGNSDFRSVDKI